MAGGNLFISRFWQLQNKATVNLFDLYGPMLLFIRGKYLKVE